MAITRYPGNHAAWTQDISIAPAGSLAAGLFNLYPSRGDATISGATNIATIQDGPIQVVRYGALTVNALLSVTNRCRGLIVLCDSLNIGAAGSISMTGRGAKGHEGWIVDDLTIPTSVLLSGRYASPHRVLDVIAQNGWFVGDPNLWALPPADLAALGVSAAITAGTVTLVTAAGCGAGYTGFYAASNNTGYPGYAGSNAPGGGGSGGYYNGGSPVIVGWGSAGYPWGGGSGGGGSSGTACNPTVVGADFCGKGGSGSGYGAGNPAGNGAESGVGGTLFIICRGNSTIASGGTIQADGMPSLSGNYTSGGGSGGGRASLICGGTLSNAGTIRANGGAYAPGTYHGGSGGVGAADTKTFAQMGWAA